MYVCSNDVDIEIDPKIQKYCVSNPERRLPGLATLECYVRVRHLSDRDSGICLQLILHYIVKN